jgi:hypothetical protein
MANLAMKEFDTLIAKARKQAAKEGLKHSDVSEAIAKARVLRQARKLKA